jgi:superfamily I DNA and RNA helicase
MPPTKRFDWFSAASYEDKFDSVIIDEGQDFEDNWYLCLQAMLRSEADGKRLTRISCGHLARS